MEPALTVNEFARVPTPPSGLVTVTLELPAVASDAIDTLTVSEVDELNVVEFTVIPVLENYTAALDTKSDPVIAKFWFDAP